MKRLAFIAPIIIALLMACSTSDGRPRGGAANGSSPAAVFPQTYYASISNGWPANQNKFPIGLYLLNPAQNTNYSGGYTNLGAAAAAAGMNIIMGQYPGQGIYPESFGSDSGQMAAAKSNGLYFVGSVFPDYTATNTANSLQSAAALAVTDSAQTNYIGVIMQDEPVCDGTTNFGITGNVNYQSPGNVHDYYFQTSPLKIHGPDVKTTPAAITTSKGYDPNRAFFGNLDGSFIWYGSSQPGSSCPTDIPAYFAATYVNSFDYYPEIVPSAGLTAINFYCAAGAHVVPSDFISRPIDCLWLVGVGVLNEIAIQPTHPSWWYVAGDNDALGISAGYSSFAATVINGSPTLTNVTATQAGNQGNSVVNIFTSSWVGLTVSGTGIPGNTCIGIVLTNTTATMQDCTTHIAKNATVTTSGAFETVSLTGGTAFTGTDCVVSVNLCVAPGIRYRETAQDVNSEVWNGVISGALGIIWFCQDGETGGFCLGDPIASGSAAALTNVKYIDATLQTYAADIQTTHDGICSMQKVDLTTTSSCTNGILTMATSSANCPGLAFVVTDPSSGHKRLFAMSDRASTTAANCTTAGQTMTFTLSGVIGTATVIYDSNAQYDSGNSSVGATHSLVANAFSDTFGANSDSYQVRIYDIQ